MVIFTSKQNSCLNYFRMEGVVMELKRICSFSVSNWHLVTMLAPYLNKKLEDGHQICTFFETDIEEIMEEFLKKLTLKQETKQQLASLNWHSNKGYKYVQIDELLNTIKNNNITIIINGNKSYIEKVNNNINKWIKKSRVEKAITIVDCYEVMQFNNSINEILDVHDKILNTSGEREIGEVFEGYGKNKQNVV